MKKITITVEEDENPDINYSFWNDSWNSWNSGGRLYNNPCEHCNNNPKNNPHASGICSCALPALVNPIF